MAQARTTLAAAVLIGDTKITVASATSLAAGRFLKIDDEWMKVTNDYTTGVNPNVLRGLNGSVQKAHAITAGVVHGDAMDFANPPAQAAAAVSGPLQRVRVMESITATGTFTPTPGQDTLLVLNGGSVIALTIAAPTKEMEGDALYIAGNGVAAHTATFTGGLSGAGASYDVITTNATAPTLMGPFMAINEKWQLAVAVPLAGTMTNVTGTLA